MDEHLLQESLESAATDGRTHEVTRLLLMGAPVGDSLHNSVVAGHVETAAELLRHGVSLLAKDRRYYLTPMQLVAHHVPAGKVRAVVDLLVAHGACIDGTGSPSPLYLSVEPGNFSTAFALLAAGADVASRSGMFNDTPVHKAAMYGCVDILLALLGSRPDMVDFTDGTGSTALHHACGRDKPDVVNVLLNASADLEARDMFGRTPLIVAAAEGADSAAAEILGRGADINAVDENVMTAIHCAAHNAGQRGVKRVIGLLLRHGADGTREDKYGRTPRDVAGNWVQDEATTPRRVLDEIVRVRALLSWRRRRCLVLLRSRLVGSSIARLAVAQGAQSSKWAGATAWLLGAPAEIFMEVVRFL